MRYRVSWTNPGPVDGDDRRYDDLRDAYEFFRYLAYEDGQAIGIGLYDEAGKTIAGWDARSGEMLSVNHADADTIRSWSRQPV